MSRNNKSNNKPPPDKLEFISRVKTALQMWNNYYGTRLSRIEEMAKAIPSYCENDFFKLLKDAGYIPTTENDYAQALLIEGKHIEEEGSQARLNYFNSVGDLKQSVLLRLMNSFDGITDSYHL